jgi:hypothetical protein
MHHMMTLLAYKKSEQNMVWLTNISIFLKKNCPKKKPGPGIKTLAWRQKPWPGDKNPGLATKTLAWRQKPWSGFLRLTKMVVNPVNC